MCVDHDGNALAAPPPPCALHWQEYYEAVSSLGYIPRIQTPTLFLVAKDDPFLG